jgi:uncharacterized protein YdaU (DUF1376 family)
MAKADAWMPLWIGDYLKDTSRLSLAEHGAYLKLLMDSWVNGPPSDDDAELCRVLGCLPSEWRRIRPKIAGFFAISGGVWNHKRLKAEKAGAVEASGKAAAKARQAAEARWHRGKGPDQTSETMPQAMLQALPEAMPQHMHEQCPSPVTYSSPTEKAVETPDARAWREGVALLTGHGRMKEGAARAFFGKLLKDNKLEPYRLLPSILGAELKGTQAPQAYLSAVAKNLTLSGGQAKPRTEVSAWGDDVWRSALQRFRDRGAWSETMGPKPDEAGCWAPPAVLDEWRQAA